MASLITSVLALVLMLGTTHALKCFVGDLSCATPNYIDEAQGSCKYSGPAGTGVYMRIPPSFARECAKGYVCKVVKLDPIGTDHLTAFPVYGDEGFFNRSCAPRSECETAGSTSNPQGGNLTWKAQKLVSTTVGDTTTYTWQPAVECCDNKDLCNGASGLGSSAAMRTIVLATALAAGWLGLGR